MHIKIILDPMFASYGISDILNLNFTFSLKFFMYIQCGPYESWTPP